MQPTFLGLICFFYLLSTCFFSLYLKKLSYAYLRLGRWFLGLAVALHFGFLLAWFLHKKIYVPSNALESQLAVLALVGFLCWTISVRKTLVFLSALVAPLICIGLIFFQFMVGPNVGATLPNPWLWTHIVLAILGEAFFFFSALISVAYLLVEFQLRRRKATTFFSRVPSLVDFDRILGENLLAGFVLLTLGLILGVFFANEYWTVGWFSDPKVLFALLTWLIYALLLALRAISPVYRGRRSAALSVIGFLGILLLSLGMPSEHHTIEQKPIEKIEK
ncbi:MAG: ccsB [Bacteriovoracaceae bacterium]|nr:ccsB [Bacteriovoracaceae bacterium]